jgi:hypothetical protein
VRNTAISALDPQGERVVPGLIGRLRLFQSQTWSQARPVLVVILREITAWSGSNRDPRPGNQCFVFEAFSFGRDAFSGMPPTTPPTSDFSGRTPKQVCKTREAILSPLKIFAPNPYRLDLQIMFWGGAPTKTHCLYTGTSGIPLIFNDYIPKTRRAAQWPPVFRKFEVP